MLQGIFNIASAQSDISSDFQYLNKIRTEAGMTQFNWNNQLADAAQNHANYLSNNNRHGHHESLGLPFYTGEWASDRAIFSGYANRMASENVTSKIGDNSFYNPVDSLMSAIYHRLGFLNLENNEAGIGHKHAKISSYVYLMGNQSISEQCGQAEFNTTGAYLYQACKDKEFKIGKNEKQKLQFQNQKLNPEIVVWPARNSINIPPVFYEESPDPLPNYSVSGYPISVQFNPAYFSQPPELIKFEIRKHKSNKPLESIVIMNKNNDPQRELNEFQHAFFPKNRLQWAQYYKALILYNDQSGDLKEHSWSFKVAEIDDPIYIINSDDMKIRVDGDSAYTLYYPPEHANDVSASLSYRGTAADVKINYIDKNTLKINTQSTGYVTIKFHQKTLTITIE